MEDELDRRKRKKIIRSDEEGWKRNKINNGMIRKIEENMEERMCDCRRILRKKRLENRIKV